MTEREAALEAELKASRIEVKLLKEKVDALARMVFGQKSEKLDPNQLMLLKGAESKKTTLPPRTMIRSRERPNLSANAVPTHPAHECPITCQ